MITALPVAILTQLIEGSLDSILIVDEHGRIRYANAAMEQLCGSPSSELVNQSLNTLLPATIAAEHDEYMRRYLKHPQSSKVLGRERELEMRHRSGEIIPIELKAIDLGTDAGTRLFGAFVLDLRPRKAIEAKNADLLTRLEQQALTDPLTGLPNRRAFDLQAVRTMSHAKRDGWPITIGIADIDWFKHLNDQYGHPIGDHILSIVAQSIQKLVRAGDLCGRIGGEEFGLLLSHATVEQSVVIAERIRTLLAKQPIEIPSAEPINITVSIGLANLDPAGSLEGALAKADAALYQAKLTGRNRIVVA